MQTSIQKTALIILSALTSLPAFAATTYSLTITNGGVMPISPSVTYVKNGQLPLTQVGQAPAPGFIQLCQTGNNMTRVQEVQMNMDVTAHAETMGLIMPGETRTVEIDVQDPLKQSLQFEAMYGKSKDACAVATFNSHSLYALKQHVTADIFAKDNVVQTGAFTVPALPAGRTYLDADVCAMQADAVSCLRSLSMPMMSGAKVRFFSPYLSSVPMLLEVKYGAAAAQELNLTSSGAVQFDLKMKH